MIPAPPVVPTPVLFHCTGGRGWIGHPAFPAPLFKGQTILRHSPGASAPRDCGRVSVGVVRRDDRKAIRSPMLTIFWHCGFRHFSSKNAGERCSGNEPSTVLIENLGSETREFQRLKGSGNAGSRPKVWSSGGSGARRLRLRDSGCVAAHPPYRRPAPYLPLRAGWAVCAWALRGCARSPDPSALRTMSASYPKGSFADDHRDQVRKGPRNHF
jgi:hypothetical protein